jgi:hypothetical protein
MTILQTYMPVSIVAECEKKTNLFVGSQPGVVADCNMRRTAVDVEGIGLYADGRRLH